MPAGGPTGIVLPTERCVRASRAGATRPRSRCIPLARARPPERCNAAQVAAVLAKSVAEAKLIRPELDRLA